MNPAIYYHNSHDSKEKIYAFRWKNNPKRRSLYGKRCQILKRGKMNSVLVKFEDNKKEIISRRALKLINNDKK